MIKYKRQEMPDLDGRGKKRMTYRFEANHNMDGQEFIKRLCAYNGVLSEGIMECALEAIADTMADMMGMGYTVTLKNIGTFTPKLGLKEADNSVISEKSLDSNYVHSPCVKGLNFRAAKKLVKRIDKQCKFERGSTYHLHRSPYTKEERAERARQYLKTHNGRIYVYEYASINGLSKTTASRELKALASDPTSGIGKEGSGSHVIYIAK